ncbi:dNA topoisomerase [Anopheles sinensis]|uniref:DNA topoisomerase n=1 Tax=Anopheles sinensis TaxID=74873 RepID=A0A084WD49_ANOSI|nr:dNA topoisomerase [Anopheles sinensis]
MYTETEEHNGPLLQVPRHRAKNEPKIKREAHADRNGMPMADEVADGGDDGDDGAYLQDRCPLLRSDD